MPDSFGAGLRQRRERQQIALTTIAEETKIKRSLLEALERDDVSRWPSGIFGRAFIRAYAHAIGLNPDDVLREFLERYPDPIEGPEPVAAIAANVDAAAVSGAPPTRLRYLVDGVIDSLSRLRPEVLRRGRPAAVEAPVVDQGTPVKAAAPPTPDLLAVAQLCTELARADDTRGVLPLLRQAARLLDAVGLIVWVWDPHAGELTPALSHGYSARVLAQLPRVRRDTDNATAAAFRSAQTSVVNGSDHASGAVVVPLMAPAGCVGVLAIELPIGSAQSESARALVTIFAAQLARLVSAPQAIEALDRKRA